MSRCRSSPRGCSRAPRRSDAASSRCHSSMLLARCLGWGSHGREFPRCRERITKCDHFAAIVGESLGDRSHGKCENSAGHSGDNAHKFLFHISTFLGTRAVSVDSTVVTFGVDEKSPICAFMKSGVWLGVPQASLIKVLIAERPWVARSVNKES